MRSIDIQADPATVWTILTKHLEHPEQPEGHNDDLILIRGVGGVPLTEKRAGVGVQTRWRYEFRGRHYTWDDEVISWEAGKRISWKAISTWTMLDSFELIQKADATRVVYRMEYRFPYGPIGWLVARVMYHKHMKRSIEATLRGLKLSAERIALLKRRA